MQLIRQLIKLPVCCTFAGDSFQREHSFVERELRRTERHPRQAGGGELRGEGHPAGRLHLQRSRRRDTDHRQRDFHDQRGGFQ